MIDGCRRLRKRFEGGRMAGQALWGPDGRRPTMKDVATLANVSLSTVSRFVNGEPGRPELVARIQQAIDLLGYQRDLTASTLRRADRASASIGVVVADVGNPFFAAVLRG